MPKKNLANVNIEQHAALLGFTSDSKAYKWGLHLYPFSWVGNCLPMIWAGGQSYKDLALARINPAYTGRILLPNEPDLAEQANMSAGAVVNLQTWTMSNFPSATIVAPNISHGDPRSTGAGNADPRLNGPAPWFRKWHAAIQSRPNAQAIYDKVAFYGMHWYWQPGIDPSVWTPTRALDELSQVLVDFDAPVKDFWVTEVGCRNNPTLLEVWLDEFTADSRVDEIFVFGTLKYDPDNDPELNDFALVQIVPLVPPYTTFTEMGLVVKNWAG